MALSVEQKTEIILQRIQQFESDLYLNELNKITYDAIGIETENTESNISQLKTAIAVHQQQLSELSS